MNVIIFTDINNNYGFGRNLGAYTVASNLREHGISTQVIDFFSYITINDLNKIIDKFINKSTKLICFSNTFFNTKESLYKTNRYERVDLFFGTKHFPHEDSFMQLVVKKIKQKNNDVKFVMGGKKTVLFRDSDLIDYWVIGDGEDSILKIYKEEVKGKLIRGEFSDYSKTKMKWDKTDFLFENESLPIEISRGCPFNCAFCSTPKLSSDVGRKSTEIIKSELLYNYDKFGITRYMIVDLTFNESPEKVREFCGLFRSLPFDIEWSAAGRLDILCKYPWMVDELSSSGLRSLWFGIESLNTNTLKVIDKSVVDPEEMKEFMYFLKEKWRNKIIFGSIFIVGLPFESRESIESTFQWVMREDSPLHSVGFYALGIRPVTNKEQLYSPIELDIEKYGYKRVSGKWYNKYSDIWEDEARVIADYYNEKVIEKNGMPPSYFYFSRLKNLRYSEREISKINFDWSVSYLDSIKRTRILKNEYIHELLKNGDI